MKERLEELIIKPEGTFLGDKELPVKRIFVQLPDSTLVPLGDIIDAMMIAKHGRGWEKKLIEGKL